jgi:glutathione-regulated potassium-efflux system protein KefB
MEDVRRRDQERLQLQLVGGITAGRSLMRGNVATPEPAPLTPPQREPRPLDAATAAVIAAESKSGVEGGSRAAD